MEIQGRSRSNETCALLRLPLDSLIKRRIFRCMAERDEKWPENVKGKFYVDEQCIDCDLCRETAPNFFTRNEDGGYSFVHKQPETEEEIGACVEALEGCPVEAIGDDSKDLISLRYE